MRFQLPTDIVQIVSHEKVNEENVGKQVVGINEYKMKYSLTTNPFKIRFKGDVYDCWPYAFGFDISKGDRDDINDWLSDLNSLFRNLFTNVQPDDHKAKVVETCLDRMGMIANSDKCDNDLLLLMLSLIFC